EGIADRLADELEQKQRNLHGCRGGWDNEPVWCLLIVQTRVGNVTTSVARVFTSRRDFAAPGADQSRPIPRAGPVSPGRASARCPPRSGTARRPVAPSPGGRRGNCPAPSAPAPPPG